MVSIRFTTRRDEIFLHLNYSLYLYVWKKKTTEWLIEWINDSRIHLTKHARNWSVKLLNGLKDHKHVLSATYGYMFLFLLLYLLLFVVVDVAVAIAVAAAAVVIVVCGSRSSERHIHLTVVHVCIKNL